MQTVKGRAQALVTRGNQVLMVQHCVGDEAWYCLPGGGIEVGESPAQAALRELREECNVIGTIAAPTGCGMQALAGNSAPPVAAPTVCDARVSFAATAPA
ncbi:MAG: NUDIX hydrolase [Oscillospiraceae bacterium]|nr:NUDIX hydrolase [Oscillospiraceae bacterium]